MKKLNTLLILGIMIMTTMAKNQYDVTYHTQRVGSVNVFYRSAGNPAKPAILLLHGFPSASHQFRELIPKLMNDFYVVAPDYPGFGQSSMPNREEFAYTFDHLAHVVDAFTDSIGLKKFAMFVFDYGAPIGFRIALWHPGTHHGNRFSKWKCLSRRTWQKWEARAEYWAHPTKELREQYKSAFAPQTIIGQYTGGTVPGEVGPDGLYT